MNFSSYRVVKNLRRAHRAVRVTARLLIVAGTLALSACAGPASRDAVARGDAVAAPKLSARFPSGFDAAGEVADFVDDDALLYRVRLLSGETVREWLICVEALGPVQSMTAYNYTVTPDDASHPPREYRSRGALLWAIVSAQESAAEHEIVVTAPADFLMTGFVPACRLAQEHNLDEALAGPVGAADAGATTKLTPVELEVIERFYISTVALFQTLQAVPELKSIVMAAIQKPSLWSMARFGGVKVSIRNEFGNVARSTEPHPAVPDATPVYSFPMTLVANQQDALNCLVTVTHPGRPLTLCAGLLAIDGVHPNDPSRRVEVRLVAARRADNRSATPPVLLPGKPVTLEKAGND
ncbi:MAG: hypothetical protein ACKVX7_11225 [Planctomycetota bacterium]